MVKKIEETVDNIATTPLHTKGKFLLTSSKEVANKLMSEGFIQIEEDGHNYVFLNESDKMVFDSPKITYTDRLNI